MRVAILGRTTTNDISLSLSKPDVYFTQLVKPALLGCSITNQLMLPDSRLEVTFSNVAHERVPPYFTSSSEHCTHARYCSESHVTVLLWKTKR